MSVKSVYLPTEVFLDHLFCMGIIEAQKVKFSINKEVTSHDKVKIKGNFQWKRDIFS